MIFNIAAFTNHTDRTTLSSLTPKNLDFFVKFEIPLGIIIYRTLFISYLILVYGWMHFFILFCFDYLQFVADNFLSFVSCSLVFFIFNISINFYLQCYIRRMGLQRRLGGICWVYFLIFRVFPAVFFYQKRLF